MRSLLVLMSFVLYATSCLSDEIFSAVRAPVGGSNCHVATAEEPFPKNFFKNRPDLPVSCGDDISFDDAIKTDEPQRRKKSQLGVLSSRCDEQLTQGYYHFWQNLNDVQNKGDYRTFLDHLRSGKAFGAYRAIEMVDAPEGERHFALCEATKIKGTVGPPRDCVTVAIIRQETTLVRMVNSGNWCYMSSYERSSGGIDVYYEIKANASIEPFANSVLASLKDELKMAAEMDFQKDTNKRVIYAGLRSTTALRESFILNNGWRETFDFDVNLRAEDGIIKVRAHAQPLVCRTASGNLIDYRAPNDAQRGAYATALNQRIGDALLRACTSGRLVDDKTIECQ